MVGFYLVTGMLGALAHVLIYPESMVPMLGASAGISGLFAAVLIMMRRSRAGTGSIMPLALLWIATAVITGIWGTPGTGEAVAWVAHIGGFLGGLALFPFLLPRRAAADPWAPCFNPARPHPEKASFATGAAWREDRGVPGDRDTALHPHAGGPCRQAGLFRRADVPSGVCTPFLSQWSVIWPADLHICAACRCRTARKDARISGISAFRCMPSACVWVWQVHMMDHQAMAIDP
ncbi:rhomboid family intramembrane serine protease [Tistrella bauzanensis]